MKLRRAINAEVNWYERQIEDCQFDLDHLGNRVNGVEARGP
jgi:hypothetical protein